MAQLARLPTRKEMVLRPLYTIAGSAGLVILWIELSAALASKGKRERGVAPHLPLRYPGLRHSILGANIHARHHCDLCWLGSSIDHFGTSRPLASKQSCSNRTHHLPYRASSKRMRVRVSAHPMAGSVGPLALGPLHFEDAQESISRKHDKLGAPAT
jgi:hypothetical protein